MSGTPLTERRRAQTRREIAEAALTLFRRDGYDSVGVESIAEYAGISLRTFYRYFAAKDEVLSPLIRSGTTDFAALVAGRPASEDLATAVEHAFGSVSAAIDVGGLIGMIGLLVDVPVLRARWLDDLLRIENALVPVIDQRSGGGGRPEHARLTAAVIVTAIRLSLETAVRQGSDTAASAALHDALHHLSRGAGLGTTQP